MMKKDSDITMMSVPEEILLTMQKLEILLMVQKFLDHSKMLHEDVKSIKAYVDEIRADYCRGDKSGGHGFR